MLDIDLIPLGGLIGPICRSTTSVLDSCLGQFRGDGRTVRTLVFGVYKIYCITGSYLWVIQKDITL